MAVNATTRGGGQGTLFEERFQRRGGEGWAAGRPPRGGVDRNIRSRCASNMISMSPPARGRESKLMEHLALQL
jgi:hypothetical protein